MDIIFMGTPDFAVPALDALHDAGHRIVAVYSQPPRPAGRGKALRPSPVHARADALGLEVRTPLSLKDSDGQDAFAALNADVAVVAAYGLILPRPVLDAPRHGCINIHASLLPRWRGAAPVHRAILAGDAVTGVTIMQMEAGLDTGPMLSRFETFVDGKTGGQLTDELAREGAALCVQTLAEIERLTPAPQPEDGVTYARKIEKAEARLDFSAGADACARQVRAFNPAPGAFFERGGERIRILEARVESQSGAPGHILDDALLIGCGADSLRPLLIQRAGKAAMPVADLLRGFRVTPGEILT